MKSISFEGYSDDLLHVVTEEKTYEYDVSPDGKTHLYVLFDSEDLACPFRVNVHYDLCWSFALGFDDEIESGIEYVQEDIQSFNSEYVVEHPYCISLVLDVPDDTRFKVFNGDDAIESSDETGSDEILWR